jgi:hypothetical protein
MRNKLNFGLPAIVAFATIRVRVSVIDGRSHHKTSHTSNAMTLSSLTTIFLLSACSIGAFIVDPTRCSASSSSSTMGNIARRASVSSAATADTPIVLPEFTDAADYLTYMETVAKLPVGFAVGTADGTFVSQEAPGLGQLPIRGTILHLTNGPTDSWAAVFTQNKVRARKALESFCAWE